ncbi:Formin-like protein 3 [Frankliniella fusca]|uniref:Formin-like protein 3 n=1 Tax=Frankliniella fusca TaxID=407009 RepID=A0AAE1LGZ6_9NEOP|nr:Formin-like protein 3 [Frankliniella fusca]
MKAWLFIVRSASCLFCCYVIETFLRRIIVSCVVRFDNARRSSKTQRQYDQGKEFLSERAKERAHISWPLIKIYSLWL